MTRKRLAAKVTQAETLLARTKEARAALKTQVEALLAEAATLRKKIASEFWELGRILVTLRELEGHTVTGFDRFDTLVAERLEIAPTSAFKLMAVAARLPRAEAVAIGQEKAYAVLGYADAMPNAAEPAALVRSDAVVGEKPISEATVREIRAATAAVRQKRPRSLAEQQRARENRKIGAQLASHFGISRKTVSTAGDDFVIRLARRQVKRLLGGE